MLPDARYHEGASDEELYFRCRHRGRDRPGRERLLEQLELERQHRRTGRTLYLFEADKGSTSTCTGACASAWPPVTASAMPMAGGGVSQSLLGTTKRADGTEQLTYNGHPLYYFAADTGSGMAKGQGVKAFGSDWYVVNAQGSKIDND